MADKLPRAPLADETVNRTRHLIEATIKECEKVLDVKVTIHDISAIFRGPEGQALLFTKRGIHTHPGCLRAKRSSEPRCRAECQFRVHRVSKIKKTPWIHHCWGGLAEVIVPVIRDNSHVCTLFAGAYNSANDSRLTPGLRRNRGYLKMLAGLPLVTDELLHRVGTVCQAVGHGLLVYVEEVNRIHQSGDGRVGAIRRYLNYHAHEAIGLADLAGVLHLSLSRTSHLITELFGMSFKSLLLKERLLRGRALLLSSPDWSVGNIARQVGIPDEYHFNRAFKKMFRLPPGRYRKKHQVG